MWQISGRSSITDFDEVVKLDREYIENWNFGKDLNGNYVVFVDSDDYIEKDMITQMMQCAVDNNADIVASSFVYNGHTQAEVGGEKLYIGKKEIQSLINRMSGNKNCKTNDQFNVSACTKLYSKHFLDQHVLVFKSEREYIWEDMAFNVDAFSCAERIYGGGPCLKYIEKDATALPAEYVAYARNDSKMADLMISGSKWRTNNIKSSFWYDGEIIECDLMKNEDNRSDCEICDEVFNFFDELGANDNILLYAPTFRADHDLSCYHMDFEAVRRALIDKYGGEWKIIVRLHPNIANLDGFMTYSESIINGSKYPGINDLIVASKFLVTDYSGCMFEGFRLKTKVVLYALDLEHYTSNERGLYFDIRNLPSPLCENMEQFISCIRNFDEDKYEEQRQNFVDEIGYCKEPGPEIIADRVLEVIEER